MLELEKRNLALTLKVRELQYLKPENERLRKALAFKEEKKTDLIGTEIVSLDPSTWRRIVVINAGKDKGINSGSYAIDEHGWLVGKIIEIGNTRSRLILIDDPNFSLPVFVGENSFGLLKGSLGGVKILYIENAEQIKAKDKVWLKISSLASPIYIGEIKKVIHDKDSLFLDVEAKIFSQNPFVHKIFIIK
jgi:rod shape-determining protein MreC